MTRHSVNNNTRLGHIISLFKLKSFHQLILPPSPPSQTASNLDVAKLNYDVILTSQLVISGPTLLSMVDFTHFKLCAQFTTNRIDPGGGD